VRNEQMATDTVHSASTPEWRSGLPFAVVGSACIVAGGLISAIAAPSASENSSWAVAYLVLIGGVAQVVVGVSQSRLAPRRLSPAFLLAEFLTWNLGNVAVIAGQLLGYQFVVDAGGVVLGSSLVLLLAGVRGVLPRVAWERRSLYAYRLILLMVLVSIPIGLVVGHLKSA